MPPKSDSLKLFEALPVVPQYETAIYSPTYFCPSCGQSGFRGVYDNYTVKSFPNLVGKADTGIGMQLVFECPYCFEKYRFHPSRSKNMDTVANSAINMFCKKCLNWEEMEKTMK